MNDKSAMRTKNFHARAIVLVLASRSATAPPGRSRVTTETVPCSPCFGTGRDFETDHGSCGECHGRGYRVRAKIDNSAAALVGLASEPLSFNI